MSAKTETIQLQRSLVNQLLSHAQQHQPHEVCGLISAVNGTPSRCYPVKNVARNDEYRFLMDSHEQIEAMRRMREHGETLYAIYHSHPHTDAQPSLHDIHESGYPQLPQIIISLNTQGVLQMAAFRFQGEQVLSLTVEMS